MPRADRLPDAMEVNDVLAVGIERRQVAAAAEPLAIAFGEETPVGVDGRDQRIARMQHERNAGGAEIAALAGNLFSELFGHLALHVGEVDAGFLEDVALRQNARASAAAAFALPSILTEHMAVEVGQVRGDTILQLLEELGSAVGGGRVHDPCHSGAPGDVLQHVAFVDYHGVTDLRAFGGREVVECLNERLSNGKLIVGRFGADPLIFLIVCLIAQGSQVVQIAGALRNGWMATIIQTEIQERMRFVFPWNNEA